MWALAIKATVILGAAWLPALALRGRSAAARHLVWTAAAAALVALLPGWLLLPALRVPAAPAGPMAVFQVFSTGRAGGGVARRSGIPGTASPQLPIDVAEAWRPSMAMLWTAGTALGLLPMLWAAALLRRVRRTARPFANPGEAEALCQEMGISRPVAILEAARGTMPMTCGVLAPVVLLPAEAVEWTPERRRVVLLHELAHVRRGDVATHLLARAALSLYWWNPLAWIAWRAFVRERERATDDLVLMAGARASEYAAHLLEVARSLHAEPVTAWAALAMARRSQLEGRLVAILDSGVDRRPAGRTAAWAAAVLAAALAAPFAALQAQDPALPPELDATMRAANSQKNHQLLDNAAAAYEKLNQYSVAQKLLEDSLAIREQVSGRQSAAYAAGLVKLGDLAAARAQRDEARAFYTKAVSLGDRPEVSPALLYLGETAFWSQDYAAADGFFQRLLTADPGGPQAGAAATWLAGVRRHQPGREGEAEALYQRALAIGNPKSFDLVNTLTNYAALLRTEGRREEATALDARAAEIGRTVARNSAAGIVPSPGVYRTGNGVSAPGLIYKVEPEYSESARAAKIAGTVLVYAEIGPDGLAHNLRIVRGLEPGLDQKALEAIARWRFRPGVRDGVPVPVAATIEVNFRLL